MAHNPNSVKALADFVRTSWTAGFTIEEVTDALKKGGWDHHTIVICTAIYLALELQVQDVPL